jgi:hypothetical protein
MLRPVESNLAMDSLASQTANIQFRLDRLGKEWDGKPLWDSKTTSIFFGLLKPRYKAWLKQEWAFWKRIGFSANQFDPKKLSVAIGWFKARHTQYHYMRSLETAVMILKDELRQYRCKQLHIRSSEDVAQLISNPGAASGITGTLHGKPKKKDWTVGELYELLCDLDGRSRASGNYGLSAEPGHRCQANGPYDEDGKRDIDKVKYKTRLVWIIDILQTILEAKWQKPVQEVFARLCWYAGGKNDSQINRLLKEYKHYYRHSFTIDMSRFDSSIPAFLIIMAFDVIKVLFENDKDFDERGWQVMVNSFINKSIYDPNTGKLVFVHDGVPSGSQWTNIIDSVVNRLMMEAFFCDHGVKYYGMNVCGDDNVCFTNFEVTESFMHTLSDYYMRNFGVIIHPDKCCINSNLNVIEYLSRSWSERGVWRLPLKILQGLGCPERYRPYAKGDADPVEIVLGYIESFPLGFEECCDERKLHAFMTGARKRVHKTDVRYLTGLMRLQKLQHSISDVTLAETVASIVRIRHATPDYRLVA